MELAVSGFVLDASSQKNEPLRAHLTSFRGYSQKFDMSLRDALKQ